VQVRPDVRLARPAVLIVALALLLAMASTASAGTKPYSVSFSASPVPTGVTVPTSLPAGMTIGSFAVTLQNDTGTQQLGSADITIPTGFTVLSVRDPDRGNVIRPAENKLGLRNINAAPGQSVTVTFDLRLPCVVGPVSYVWNIQAKQANDFLGTGNDLTSPPVGTRTNTVTGSCSLRFVDGGEPQGAQKGANIRAEEYLPDSTRLVSVEAIDGRQDDQAQRVTWFGGQVGMAKVTGPGQLTHSPVLASGGVARFQTLQLSSAGTYSLRATTPDPGFTLGDSSDAFPIVDVAARCLSNASCKASLGPTSITSAAGPGTGALVLSENIGPEPRCAGYTPPPGSWYEFAVTAGLERSKLILTNFTKAQMRSFKGGGAAALEVCFAAPGVFDTKFGSVDYDYNGMPGQVGLLRDCPAVRTSVCVTRRGTSGGGGAFIEFFAPADLFDPRYH
jgi:hypothetical protein